MTILYEGFNGYIADPILGWFLIAMGIILFINFIYLVINDDWAGSTIGILLFAIVLVLIGVFAMKDRQYPIIKATINEETSWQDINNKYELIEQEGRIYTFKVKNMTNEE